MEIQFQVRERGKFYHSLELRGSVDSLFKQCHINNNNNMNKILNQDWHKDEVTGNYVTKASSLGRWNWQDPWNNPIPQKNVLVHRDADNDVVKWVCDAFNPEDNVHVTLVIFND